jgi:hypothetical protein
VRSLTIAVVTLVALAACPSPAMTLAAVNASPRPRADRPIFLDVREVATGFVNPRSISVSYNLSDRRFGDTAYLVVADGYPGGTAGVYEVFRDATGVRRTRQIVTMANLGGGRPLTAAGQIPDNFCSARFCSFSVTTDKGSVYEVNSEF